MTVVVICLRPLLVADSTDPPRNWAVRAAETLVAHGVTGSSGPRAPAVARQTIAELFVFDAPRSDRLELDGGGEPVSWVAQAQIDRLIYH